MHNYVALAAAEVPGPPLNLADELKQSGLVVICLTSAVDYQALPNGGEAYEWFQNGLATHANVETVAATLKVSTTRILVSHTGLATQLGPEADMARMMRLQPIRKEQAKLVAE